MGRPVKAVAYSTVQVSPLFKTRARSPSPVDATALSIAASPDRTKVVVANQAGYVSMINTLNDTESTRVPGPKACDSNGNNCVTQQAVIVGVI